MGRWRSWVCTSPSSVQYGKMAGADAVRGEFGISYKYKMDVLEVIAGRVGNTLLLGGSGLRADLCAGAASWESGARGTRKNAWIDRAICQIGTVTSCIPEFWLSLVLILIFAVELQSTCQAAEPIQ